MTQPRKHQVKDLKTKSTEMDTVGLVKLGGTVVQNLDNNISYQSYDDLLAQSITGSPGGADTSAPPILYGGFGPFINIVSGNSFTVVLPNVNSGNPISIVVQPTDIVVIGGNPVLTTSRTAALINRNLALFSVSTPVASNQNGQLILTGADTSGQANGDDAFITITDVTIGVLLKMGFTSNPSIANGTTAPKRGIVTQSQDGLGGHIALRKEDNTPAVTTNPALLTFPSATGSVALRYTEEVPPGQPIYASLRQFPGPHDNGERFEFSFFKKGPVKSKLITNQSDFSSLSGADTVSITIFDPERGVYEVVVVTFTIPPTTPQNVVSAINTEWNAKTLADTGYKAGSAVVMLNLAGPYAFDASDSFFISFQTVSPPIKISPSSSVVTTSDLVAFIQAAIVGAGAAAQGQATSIVDPVTSQLKVIIKSLNDSGSGSQVVIYPGSNGPNPGSYMTTLEKVGLVSGTFKGSAIAFLYGNDEVVIENPSYILGTSVAISGTAPTMARFGFSSASVFNISAFGSEPTPAPYVNALIPEVMEFGEVPDGTDTTTQQFFNTDDISSVNPIGGISNFGTSPIVDQDGQIFENLIRKNFPFLSVDQLVLGNQLTGSLDALLKPRVTTPTDSSGAPLLIWEASLNLSSSPDRFRLYIINLGSDRVLQQTWNAWYDGTNFHKDVESSAASSIVTVKGSSLHLSRSAALAGPWGFAGWDGQQIIVNGAEEGSFISDPRVSNLPILRHFGDSNSVPYNGNYTLIFQDRNLGNGGMCRIYTYNNGGSVEFATTINAKWNPATGKWEGDDIASFASKFSLIAGFGRIILNRKDITSTPWTDLDWSDVSVGVIGTNDGTSLQYTTPIIRTKILTTVMITAFPAANFWIWNTSFSEYFSLPGASAIGVYDLDLPDLAEIQKVEVLVFRQGVNALSIALYEDVYNFTTPGFTHDNTPLTASSTSGGIGGYEKITITPGSTISAGRTNKFHVAVASGNTSDRVTACRVTYKDYGFSGQ